MSSQIDSNETMIHENESLDLTSVSPHKKVNLVTLSWISISIAWLFYLYEYILRVSPAVISNQIMTEFSVTATAVGAISGAYYWSYVPLQIPCGIIADRLGARKVIIFSCLLCILGSFVFSLSTSYTTAIFSRILMGAGSACAYICCSKVAAEWFHPHKFATLTAITMFMGTLGASLNTVFAIVVKAFGWQQAFVIFALLGLLIVVAAWTLMKEKVSLLSNNSAPTIIKNTNSSLEQNSYFDGLKIVVKNRDNWLVGLYGCVMYLPLCAFAELWGVPFLCKKYGITPEAAAQACVWVFLGMGIGCIAGAAISNTIKSRKKVLSWSIIATFISFCIIFHIENLSFKVMQFVMAFAGFVSGGQILYFTVAKEQTPLQYSATAVSFINALVMCSGIIFQPLLGKILDLSWKGLKSSDGIRIYEITDFQNAFNVVLLALIIGWILILFVKESYQDSNNEL